MINQALKCCRATIGSIVAAVLSGCAVPPGKFNSPLTPLPHTPPRQTGVASWYGPGFHGQPTASGATYNQYDLTAAHQTLPLGSRVLVTNLNNGKSTEVLVNDRGPFVKDRIIDLSHAAAESLDIIGPGTAPVRIEVIEAPYRIQAIRSSLDYTLQVGSFIRLENAEHMRDRLRPLFSEIAILPTRSADRTYYRVQVGTFANRAAAEERARVLADSGYSVIIMEK
jgi:rare lipoprotein A